MYPVTLAPLRQIQRRKPLLGLRSSQIRRDFNVGMECLTPRFPLFLSFPAMCGKQRENKKNQRCQNCINNASWKKL